MNIQTLKWLIRRDFWALGTDIRLQLLDALLWPIKSVILFGYFLPKMGFPARFGPFILIGTIVAVSFFRIYDFVNAFMTDVLYHGLIDYELTLAVPSWIVFSRRILAYMVRLMVTSFCVYIIGSFLLMDQFSGMPFSISRALLIFFLYNLLFATATLFIASHTYTSNLFRSFWSPILFTAWDFGCYLFSFATVLAALPFLAYINLANPMTYAMEGARSAFLGPDGYMPFWICVTVLIVSTALFFWAGVRALQKRFDTVDRYE